MKENDLLVPQKRYRAKRQPEGRKPRAERPGQFWGIDMTKFIIPGLGWAYLVIFLDWFSRKVVGWRLSWRCRTQEWREALEEAVLQEFPHKVRGQRAETGVRQRRSTQFRSFPEDDRHPGH